jgi:hypothetical protein
MKPIDNNPQFSYFVAPINNVFALRDMDLATVYKIVATDFLKIKTDQVHHGLASKSRVLPYITPSGSFKRRNICDLKSYSGIICIDLDNCNIAVKSTLAADTFLNPALIFVSPSGNGIKLFIQINNARQEDHVAHFNVIAHYLSETYQLTVDQSGKDIPRACFLCHDPEAYFSRGSIDSQPLLATLPPAQAEAAIQNSSASPLNNSSLITQNLKSPSSVVRSTLEIRPSDLLNQLSAVHARAVAALRSGGWSLNGERWTRPGRTLKDGSSAIFNYFDKENLYIFTNFSTNGTPFEVKGYSDVGVICTLEFGGNFDNCIHTLAREYLP